MNNKNEQKVEDEGIDVLTIGIYTAGGFFAILLIFICFLTVERIRKKRKRITEIVEL